VSDILEVSMVWLIPDKLPGAGGDINIITQTGIGASAGTFALQPSGSMIALNDVTAKWRGELRRFLSSLAPGTRHRDIADRLTLGTGRWFLERSELESWIRSDKEGDGRVLCCVGNPGVGKTGLAYGICLIISFEYTLI
jgi:hypothetical protein